MKKLRPISLLLLLIFFSQYLTAQTTFDARNGGPFTPKGDLRVLVIFAGFEDQCNNPSDPLYNSTDWPLGTNCDALPTWANNLFYTDFSSFSSMATDKTLSNFYYQASRKSATPLRIVADIYPQRVNISESYPNNAKVFEKIETSNPSFDWSKYDNRINNPNFQHDYSQWGQTDGIVDYVVVIWRVAGLGGYSSTTYYPGSNFEINSQCGFTVVRSVGFGDRGTKNLFRHEMAHSLYNSPHLYGANGLTGQYFYTGSGWGMMAPEAINNSPNAWESLYLGWLEIPTGKHINSAAQNGSYTLQDFVTTGDFMVIDLPFTGQRLWLENHAKTNSFEERDGFDVDGCGTPIAPAPSGVLMYVENLTLDPSTNLNTGRTASTAQFINGLKALHAGGNYDYILAGNEETSCTWDNRFYNFNTTPNPTSQENDLVAIRNNYPYETNYPDDIIYRDAWNNGNDGCHNPYRCFGTLGNEQIRVWKKNNTFYPYWLGTNMGFGNTLPQKVGLSYNPVIINRQFYDPQNDELSPIYLNGISIKFLSKNSSNGAITFEVKYNDTDIEQDQRLTGTLELNDIPNATYDLNIKAGKWLTINKSGTPNRSSKTTDGDFINPTVLIVKDSAKVNLEGILPSQPMPPSATILLKDNSQVVFESGSRLTMNPISDFYVRDNSYLEFKDNASITLETGASIQVLESGELCIRNVDNLTMLGSSWIRIDNDTWKARKAYANTTTFQDKNFLDYVTFGENTPIDCNSSDIIIKAGNYIDFNPGASITPGTSTYFTTSIESPLTCHSTTLRVAAKNPVNQAESFVYPNMDEINDGCFRSAVNNSEQAYSSSPTRLESGANVNLYPSPSDGIVNVSLNSGKVITEIAIKSISGIELQKLVLNTNKATLNMRNYSPGIYLVFVKTDVGEFVEKVVIK